MPGHGTMVYQLDAFRKFGITNGADVCPTFVCLHMVSEKDRLGEATIANITFVGTDVIVHPENDEEI